MNNENLSHHPLHISILESFADLRAAPGAQQASFTATLSRILTEAFIASDPACNMPAFLTDKGVQVLRFAMFNPQSDTVPGALAPVGDVMSAYLDHLAEHPNKSVEATSGSFTLCSVFPTLEDLLKHPTLIDGGLLGFYDPIYEDSLILVRVSRAAQADWYLRLIDAPQSVA